MFFNAFWGKMNKYFLNLPLSASKILGFWPKSMTIVPKKHRKNNFLRKIIKVWSFLKKSAAAWPKSSFYRFLFQYRKLIIYKFFFELNQSFVLLIMPLLCFWLHCNVCYDGKYNTESFLQLYYYIQSEKLLVKIVSSFL